MPNTHLTPSERGAIGGQQTYRLYGPVWMRLIARRGAEAYVHKYVSAPTKSSPDGTNPQPITFRPTHLPLPPPFLFTYTPQTTANASTINTSTDIDDEYDEVPY